MNNKKLKNILYGVRWSSDTEVWKVLLPEKSTVKEILLRVSKKMGFTSSQITNLTVRGSIRPQNKYALDQYAPEYDILVIFKG